MMLVPETEMRGPAHSLYPKVVVPWKVTVVPDFKPVRSRVVPAGTVMPLMTISVQEALFLIAVAASVKVHPARASRPDGAAETSAPALRSIEVRAYATIVLAVEKRELRTEYVVMESKEQGKECVN